LAVSGLPVLSVVRSLRCGSCGQGKKCGKIWLTGPGAWVTMRVAKPKFTTETQRAQRRSENSGVSSCTVLCDLYASVVPISDYSQPQELGILRKKSGAFDDHHSTRCRFDAVRLARLFNHGRKLYAYVSVPNRSLGTTGIFSNRGFGTRANVGTRREAAGADRAIPSATTRPANARAAFG
jgi:hypothetical protein